MRRLTTAASAVLLSLVMPAGSFAQPPAIPPLPPPAKLPDPTYTIALKTRHACVTPHAHRLARVEGGFIEVDAPVPNTVVATMTGTAAANSYLGCTGTATENFQLVQDFEITGSDPTIRTVALTLDTSLVGFVRSKGRAGAWVRRAEVSVTPVDSPGMPMVQAYPSLTVEGTGGQLCNQHLPPLEVRGDAVGALHPGRDLCTRHAGQWCLRLSRRRRLLAGHLAAGRMGADARPISGRVQEVVRLQGHGHGGSALRRSARVGRGSRGSSLDGQPDCAGRQAGQPPAPRRILLTSVGMAHQPVARSQQ